MYDVNIAVWDLFPLIFGVAFMETSMVHILGEFVAQDDFDPAVDQLTDCLDMSEKQVIMNGKKCL